MLIGAATSRMTAIVGPPSATDSGISAVSPARPRSATNIIRLRSLRSAMRAGDHPEEEVRERLQGTDDAHRETRPGEGQDEQRQRREADRVAERRHALAREQDLEVAVPGERLLAGSVRASLDGTGGGPSVGRASRDAGRGPGSPS